MLTDRQAELSVAIREVANIPDNDSWGPFGDFTRAVACMIDGAEGLRHPSEMQKRFAGAWAAYAKMWATEHNRIVRECLGGSQKELERVKSHPNGRAAIGKILNRVKEVHGDLTPGMAINVNVGDILLEEITD